MLNYTDHGPLIAKLASVCKRAGIREEHIQTPLVQSGGPRWEIDYIKTWLAYYCSYHTRRCVYNHPGLPKWKSGGLCTVLDDYPGVDLREFNVTDRFQYLCAAVVRQYIDAKVTTIPTLLELTKTGENLDVFELIFIPDFVSGLSMLPSFDVKDIYSLLSSRISSGKHFVVYMDAPLPEKSPFIPILKGAFNYPDEFKYPDKWKQAAELERSMNHE